MDGSLVLQLVANLPKRVRVDAVQLFAAAERRPSCLFQAFALTRSMSDGSLPASSKGNFVYGAWPGSKACFRVNPKTRV